MDSNCFFVGFCMILSSLNSLMGFRTHLSRTHDTFMEFLNSAGFPGMLLATSVWGATVGNSILVAPARGSFKTPYLDIGKHRKVKENQ